METLRQHLQVRQDAIPCTDAEMLDIVCTFIDNEFGGIWPSKTYIKLVSYVHDTLVSARGPSEDTTHD